MANRILQFKITLKGITPPIWREIQVPDTYSFWDLHVAIQDAMGWEDRHLHSFHVIEPKSKIPRVIGLPDDESIDDIFAGWDILIVDYFIKEKSEAIYTYDFGDDWIHEILLQRFVEPRLGIEYPICTAGELGCPPEDCGGMSGYENFLNILSNPDHDNYRDLIESGGEFFDPEYFNPDDVIFEDPEERKDGATKELWDF
ncbi:MAG: plasmid pRiA4b ORF-3 family protein [Calditrichaeota bacterium]|jgi:hypothetical protein|nr:plasmid pRiA4b ORF-3 family protein [Calditrichota bacterium]